MKKWIRLLCLTLALPVGALPACADMELAAEDEIYLYGMTAYQDGLVAISGSGALYRFDADLQPAALELSGTDPEQFYSPDRLAAEGDALYAYCGDGSLHEVTLGEGSATEGAALCQIDLGEEGWRSCAALTVSGGRAYALLSPADGSWDRYELWELDPATGKTALLTTDCMLSLSAYKDGKLLTYYWDRMNAYQGTTVVMPELRTYDPQTGTLAPLCTLSSGNLGGIVYDAAADAIYLANSTGVYRVEGDGSLTRCAYIAMNYVSEDAAAALVNGTYCIFDTSAKILVTASTDPAKLPERALRIAGSWMDDTLTAFTRAHPEVPVELVDTAAYDGKSIAESMASGADSVDVYTISLAYGGFASLRDKGYCTDLSGSDLLMEKVQAMYPQFTQSFLVDGHLWAYPATASCNGVAYSPDVLAALGMTEEDLPTTWGELIDFCVDFINENDPDDSEYKLMDMSTDFYLQLLSHILVAYTDEYTARGDAPRFDTPLLRELLEKLEKAKTTLHEVDMEPDADGSFSYTYEDPGHATSLLDFYTPLTPSYRDYVYKPLLVSADPAETPSLALTMNVYVVNPNSTAADLALTFLEYMAEHGDDTLRIVLDPNENDPVENASSLKFIANVQEQLDSMKAELETAAPEDRKELEVQLENAQDWLKWAENSRWIVSSEDIEAWRALVPYVTAGTESGMYNAMNEDSSALFQRYADGQLDAANFLQQFDRVVRMMQMENQ